MKIKLVCQECGWESTPANIDRCPCCDYSLDVQYDYDQISAEVVCSMLEHSFGIWDYAPMLPVENPECIISMDEGNTPLLQSKQIGPALGVNLFFKIETRNPSCSFKDRPNTVAISMARELGIDTVVIASTGNAGSSLATYAARAGMRCFVFVPATTPTAKIVQAAAHGAVIIKVRGNYSDAYWLALEASRKYNWANLTSTYLNPYTIEGDKTIAYELYKQLKSAPDWITVPLGAGALLSGVYKGFCELQNFGLPSSIPPRMMGVQAEGCSPITSAFEAGAQTVSAFMNPKTVADGICDPLIGYERDGIRTLRSIYASSGAGISVSDRSILDCLDELAKKEAIFCEPASASALSAVYLGVERGFIKKQSSVVALITGHGLKAVEEISKAMPINYDILETEASLDKFEDLMKYYNLV